MLRVPRYEARPFRACSGVVATAPSSAASRAACSASSGDASRSPSWNAARAGNQASTMVLSPSTAAPRDWIPASAARRAASRSSGPHDRIIPEEGAGLAERDPVEGSGRATPRGTSTWRRSAAGALPGDRSFTAFREASTARKPRSMLMPWSASPIAASSCVRWSRWTAISVAMPRSHRSMKAASSDNSTFAVRARPRLVDATGATITRSLGVCQPDRLCANCSTMPNGFRPYRTFGTRIDRCGSGWRGVP